MTKRQTKTRVILIAFIVALFGGLPGLLKAQESGIALGFTDEECKKMNGLCSESILDSLGVSICSMKVGCCTQNTDCPTQDMCHPGVCEMSKGASTGQCGITAREGCSIDTEPPSDSESASCTTAADCPYPGKCSEASCVQGMCSYHLPANTAYGDLPDECKCSEVSACDDANSCTEDSCKDMGDRRGLCLWKAAAYGTSCDDGLFCNGLDYCDGGQCMRDTPPCQDEDDTDCSETVCDEGKDQCFDDPIDECPAPPPPAPVPSPEPVPPLPAKPQPPAPEPAPEPTPVAPTPPPAIPTPPAPAPEEPSEPQQPRISCTASPEDIVTDKDGNQVIVAITRMGAPTPVTLEVEGQTTGKFLSDIGTIEWRQDSGTTLVSQRRPSEMKEIKALTGPTVLASESEPTLDSPAGTYGFLAPIPYGGRGEAVETYAFTATAKDHSGRALWSAPVQCQIGLEIYGGGGVGGCSLIR